MLRLTAINSNNAKLIELAKKLTPDQWRSKKIGNKKLSKHLLSLGLDNKDVSDLLSATVTDTTRIVSDEDTCLNQGNSIYYSSCQATDDRAKHEGSSFMNSIDGDMIHLGKSLFFWVAGESMSVDGKGFTARAKLRIMYCDTDHSEVFGLWLERIYGNALILLSNFKDLTDWWNGTMQQSTPVYKKSFKRKNGIVYIPSAQDGYQDTTSYEQNYYELVVGESLISKAYKARIKEGTYKYPLSAVKFNPQNCELVLPKIEKKKYRGHIDKTLRSQINMMLAVFGFPKSSYFDRRDYMTYVNFTYNDNVTIALSVHFERYILDVNNRCILMYERDELNVLEDYGDFKQAMPLPYWYDENEFRVCTNLGEYRKALGIPYEVKCWGTLVIYSHSGFYEAMNINWFTECFTKEQLMEKCEEFVERESTNKID